MLIRNWKLMTILAPAAVMLCLSQAGWAQDNSSAEDRDDVPGPNLTNAASLEERLSSVIDLPFKQYVDITLLRDAYANCDASALVDIGLQLQEGERVLKRPHRAFEARQILEIALRLASAQQDTGTLNRLATVAEVSGDKELGESINIANQLASEQRAPVPPLPEASETLSLEEISVLNNMLTQLETARAVGSRDTLLELQSRLKESPLEQGEFRSYLEAQLSEAISQSAELLEESDATVKALEALSGETRAITFAQTSMAVIDPTTRQARTAYYQDACPVREEVGSGMVNYVDISTGTIRTAPRNTIEGLRALYGAIYVNYGTFMEIQIDAQGNAVMENASKGWAARAFPRRALTVTPGKENEIQVTQRRPEGGWYTQPYTITMNQALTWALEMPNGQAGPMMRGNTPLVSVTGAAVLPERVIAKKSGSFTMLELKSAGFGFTELQMVEKAEGGHLSLPTNGLIGNVKDVFTKAGPGGNATITQIVAAGGGNITVNQIVAAGGGNIVAAGGGNIVAAGGGNIVAAGGGNLLGRISMAVSETINEDIRLPKFDFLIGKGGAGLGALLGNDASRLASVSRPIDIGLQLNPQNLKEVKIDPNFAGKLGTLGRSLLSTGASNPDFVNAKPFLK